MLCSSKSFSAKSKERLNEKRGNMLRESVFEKKREPSDRKENVERGNKGNVS